MLQFPHLHLHISEIRWLYNALEIFMQCCVTLFRAVRRFSGFPKTNSFSNFSFHKLTNCALSLFRLNEFECLNTYFLSLTFLVLFWKQVIVGEYLSFISFNEIVFQSGICQMHSALHFFSASRTGVSTYLAWYKILLELSYCYHPQR